MKRNIILRKSFYAVAIAALGLLGSCQPDEVKNGNPLTEANLDASFTAASADGNHYTVTAVDNADIQYHTWKMTKVGDPENSDEGETVGTATKDYTFTAIGTYIIQHRVVGRTGGTNSVTEQNIIVDHVALGPNILSSPNFETPSDWTILNISNNNAVNWAFNSGSATVSGGDTSYSGKGIYQAVTVEEGTYQVDLHVAGPGSTDTWFEVYISPTAPVQGADYTADGIKLGLNTWTGCGNTAFDGQLSVLHCTGSGATVHFASAGTVYFVIKSGSGAANGINSITVSDVEMRKI